MLVGRPTAGESTIRARAGAGGSESAAFGAVGNNTGSNESLYPYNRRMDGSLACSSKFLHIIFTVCKSFRDRVELHTFTYRVS